MTRNSLNKIDTKDNRFFASGNKFQKDCMRKNALKNNAYNDDRFSPYPQKIKNKKNQKESSYYAFENSLNEVGRLNNPMKKLQPFNLPNDDLMEIIKYFSSLNISYSSVTSANVEHKNSGRQLYNMLTNYNYTPTFLRRQYVPRYVDFANDTMRDILIDWEFDQLGQTIVGPPECLQSLKAAEAICEDLQVPNNVFMVQENNLRASSSHRHDSTANLHHHHHHHRQPNSTPGLYTMENNTSNDRGTTVSNVSPSAFVSTINFTSRAHNNSSLLAIEPVTLSLENVHLSPSFAQIYVFAQAKPEIELNENNETDHTKKNNPSYNPRAYALVPYPEVSTKDAKYINPHVSMNMLESSIHEKKKKSSIITSSDNTKPRQSNSKQKLNDDNVCSSSEEGALKMKEARVDQLEYYLMEEEKNYNRDLNNNKHSFSNDLDVSKDMDYDPEVVQDNINDNNINIDDIIDVDREMWCMLQTERHTYSRGVYGGYSWSEGPTSALIKVPRGWHFLLHRPLAVHPSKPFFIMNCFEGFLIATLLVLENSGNNQGFGNTTNSQLVLSQNYDCNTRPKPHERVPWTDHNYWKWSTCCMSINNESNNHHSTASSCCTSFPKRDNDNLNNSEKKTLRESTPLQDNNNINEELLLNNRSTGQHNSSARNNNNYNNNISKVNLSQTQRESADVNSTTPSETTKANNNAQCQSCIVPVALWRPPNVLLFPYHHYSHPKKLRVNNNAFIPWGDWVNDRTVERFYSEQRLGQSSLRSSGILRDTILHYCVVSNPMELSLYRLNTSSSSTTSSSLRGNDGMGNSSPAAMIGSRSNNPSVFPKPELICVLNLSNHRIYADEAIAATEWYPVIPGELYKVIITTTRTHTLMNHIVINENDMDKKTFNKKDTDESNNVVGKTDKYNNNFSNRSYSNDWGVYFLTDGHLALEAAMDSLPYSSRVSRNLKGPKNSNNDIEKSSPYGIKSGTPFLENPVVQILIIEVSVKQKQTIKTGLHNPNYTNKNNNAESNMKRGNDYNNLDPKDYNLINSDLIRVNAAVPALVPDWKPELKDTDESILFVSNLSFVIMCILALQVRFADCLNNEDNNTKQSMMQYIRKIQMPITPLDDDVNIEEGEMNDTTTNEREDIVNEISSCIQEHMLLNARWINQFIQNDSLMEYESWEDITLEKKQNIYMGILDTIKNLKNESKLNPPLINEIATYQNGPTNSLREFENGKNSLLPQPNLYRDHSATVYRTVLNSFEFVHNYNADNNNNIRKKTKPDEGKKDHYNSNMNNNNNNNQLAISTLDEPAFFFQLNLQALNLPAISHFPVWLPDGNLFLNVTVWGTIGVWPADGSSFLGHIGPFESPAVHVKLDPTRLILVITLLNGKTHYISVDLFEDNDLLHGQSISQKDPKKNRDAFLSIIFAIEEMNHRFMQNMRKNSQLEAVT